MKPTDSKTTDLVLAGKRTVAFQVTETKPTPKLKANQTCGKCYVKSNVTNPGIAGGHIENEIIYCPLHAAAPALYQALKNLLASRVNRDSRRSAENQALVALAAVVHNEEK